ncbi:kinase-like domain-containing protein [Ganoderma leucocontextum]|nr:kinase-like domain-containing protein [Ganoderma leucocontextum]
MRLVYEVPPLGEGGYGRVYKARVLGGEDSRVVALKKSRMNNSVPHPCLLHEACGFVLNRGHPSIPEVFGWGRSQFYEYLATELLGCNLATGLDEMGLTRGNFFAAVKHVHSRGILHCDIKPSNFVFGVGRNAGRIYLIDFNLWTSYRNFKTHEHLPADCAPKGYRGTCHYASINCHLDQPLSRRDDIESLAYTIFDIYADELPWSSLSHEESAEIGNMKQVWHMTYSFHGNCKYPLGYLMEYARSLQYDQEPDYDRWRREFWQVDNGTAALPESDPMYDPEDATEQLPRNMDFITTDPPAGTYDIQILADPDVNKIFLADGSDHGYIPASENWGHPRTMLPQDTMRNEREVIRDFVECITEVPTTTHSHLAPKCPEEEMRRFDDPIPFKPVDIPSSKGDRQGEVGGAAGGEQLAQRVGEGGAVSVGDGGFGGTDK